jgi:ribosome-associated protein
MLESAAKKDTAKLQRAIIDGLEDVKAQEIAVFDTEHLTALFERVIIASGTSNRQTKALASSVRDAVREAGFDKPRIEGEDNGEWIIVDCHQCVVHIMQPQIRTYYHLEEIWGDKPVRLKLGAPKPVVAVAKPAPEAAKGKKPAAKKAGAKTSAKPGAKRKPAKPEPVFAPPRPELAPPSAAKKAAMKRPAAAAPKVVASRATAPKKAADTKPATKLPVKVVGKVPAKKVASKTATKTASKSASKTASKAVPVKRSRA